MPVEEYLAAIITPLLSRPESLLITSRVDSLGLILFVQVDKADMGSIIGKEGETAKAIRHMVRIIGVRQNSRVSVKINEPDGTIFKPRRDVELLASD